MYSAIDPFRTIDAPVRRSGRADLIVRNTPVRFVRRTSSNSFFRCFCNRPELSDARVGKDNIQVTELIFNLIED